MKRKKEKCNWHAELLFFFIYVQYKLTAEPVVVD